MGEIDDHEGLSRLLGFKHRDHVCPNPRLAVSHGDEPKESSVGPERYCMKKQNALQPSIFPHSPEYPSTTTMQNNPPECPPPTPTPTHPLVQGMASNAAQCNSLHSGTERNGKQ